MSNSVNSVARTSGDTVYEQLGLKEKEIYTGREEAVQRQTIKDLDKDVFLQLMITKLQNQDPLSPTDDTEFLAQLAQFTTLEQMTNLASTTEMSQGFSMVGKYVSVKVGEENIIAKVDSVVSKNGKIQLNIGGYLFEMDDIQEVFDPDIIVTDPGDSEETPENSETSESGSNAAQNASLAQDITSAVNKYSTFGG